MYVSSKDSLSKQKLFCHSDSRLLILIAAN